MPDNFELNQLLEEAKQAQQGLDKWRRTSGYKRLPEGELLHQSAQNLWALCHRAMMEAVPIELTLANGEIREARTIGALTEDLLMFYSESFNSKSTNEGINLQFITSAEEMKSTVTPSDFQPIDRDWTKFNINEFDDLSSEEVEAYSAWQNGILSRLIELVKTQEQRQ